MPPADMLEGSEKVEVLQGSRTLSATLRQICQLMNGGEFLPIVKTNQAALLTDENILSSLRTLKEIADAVSAYDDLAEGKFLRKDLDDNAAGVITFLKGLVSNEPSTFLEGLTSNELSAFLKGITSKESSTFEKGLKVGDYLQGLSGGTIDENANAELNSLKLREFLETPELRKNRITVNGNEFWFTDCCVIESVSRIGTTDEYVVTPRLLEGDLISFRSSDILRGVYSYDNGFFTSVMQVVTVNSALTSMVVVTLNDKPPMPFMVLARQTNGVDTDRQGSIYADGLNKYIRVLNGYNEENPTALGDINTLKLQIGNLSGVNHPVFGALSGYGLFAQNAYLLGTIMQVSGDGTEYQKPTYWRGTWNRLKPYYIGDLVRWYKQLYGESTYRCTKDAPAVTADNDDTYAPSNLEYWELYIPAGEPAYQITVSSTKGTSFLNGSVNTTLHAVLYMGSNDVTASIPDTDVSWERTSDDDVSDQIWNLAHVSAGKYININTADLINRKAQFWAVFNI